MYQPSPHNISYISYQLSDEWESLPIKCQNCMWRTGRVCMFSYCIKDNMTSGDRVGRPLPRPVHQ
ncbi:hypothetical protein MM817_02734 [Acidibacillus sp. S0AB]|uniref:Uncharacterized protein n=1 Tax=Sulfoacidibacillus ferrooxidans TaxID=2005001 RepID=A0A9X2AFH4_9BACL|nr:hypothetical protein [Sulfoacidibacillus ferrooxidans]